MANASSTTLNSTSGRPPSLSKHELQDILTFMLGKTIEIKYSTGFPSYYDRNYYLELDKDQVIEYLEGFKSSRNNRQQKIDSCYVLKILNAKETKDIEVNTARLNVMQFLYDQGIRCPCPLPLPGQHRVKVVFISKENSTGQYIAYLINFIEGQILSTIHPDNDLLYRLGKFAGQVIKTLQSYSGDPFHNYTSMWSLRNFLQIRSYLKYYQEDDRNTYLTAFERLSKFFKQDIDNFRRMVIHNDINDQNVIIKFNDSSNKYDISGIIDFSLMISDCMVFEIGIMIAYVMLIHNIEPLEAAGYTIAGFHKVFPLTLSEYKALHKIATSRLLQSVITAHYELAKDTTNPYILNYYQEKCKIFNLLNSTSEIEIYRIWDDITGLESNKLMEK